MTQLPTSIQQYLEESGFTPTEIAVLKKLIEGQPVTIRELAAKCGKSVGTLTQAMQKLADKGIISKKNINKSSKYDIESIDAIKKWIERDTMKKYELLKRKKENFDAFMATVEQEKNRPDMEYFNGLDGMQKAYEKLLESDSTEWLKFCPADIDPQQNPLQEFDAELFRERKRRGISIRVLCPDTLNGKRRKDKDPYEHRETKLLKSVEFPVAFTKFIVGDVVASFDFAQHKASFMCFPEFADGQRNMFEHYWDIATADEQGGGVIITKKEVPLEKRVAAQLKKFFFGKKSVVSMVGIALIAAVVTGGMYFNNFRLQKDRLADKAVAIASTAALEINGDALEGIRTKDDMQTDTYQNVFNQFNDIRDTNEGVVYIYAIRPHEDPTKYEWIVDADANYDMPEYVDTHGDGVLDGADENLYPGLSFDVSDITELQTEDLQKPIRTTDFNSDQWGTFISGFAPVFNSNEELVALLGVDYWAEDVQSMTLETFNPARYYLVIFSVLVLVRLFAFHEKLSKDLRALMKTKEATVTLVVCTGVAVVVTLVIQDHYDSINTERVRERVKAIAATAAPEFSAFDLDKIRAYESMKTELYQNVIDKLDEIRMQNPEVEYGYIMRYTDDPYFHEFIVDADSGFPLKREDLNEDGILNDSIIPGRLWYDDDPQTSAILAAKNGPSADPTPMTDEWGIWISGHAPIIRDGELIGILGIDMNASEVDLLTKKDFSFFSYFTAIFLVLASSSVVFKFIYYDTK